MRILIVLLFAALALVSCTDDNIETETIKETQIETQIETESESILPETETETETETLLPETIVIAETIIPLVPETETVIEIETEILPPAETEPIIEENTETETIAEETTPVVEETESIISTVIKYPISYSDDTCEITITKEWYEDATVYAAHIVFTEYDRLGTSCSFGTYNIGYETTTDAAARIGSLLTVNGCHSASYPDKIVVRDGIVYNGGNKDLYLPAIYSSNTGLLMNASSEEHCEFFGRNVNELVDGGLFTDSFYFHFPFLVDGEIHCNLGNSRAQRTFIGTNGEAGNIWIIVSDGRWNDGVSPGLTYDQCAAYLQSNGCTFGVALDGGGSTTMVWQGNVLNAVGLENQRAVVDFVYFK